MAVFPKYTPKIPSYQAVQWTDDPEVVDDLKIWLTENYAPETAGLIAEFADDPDLSPPGPRGWEIQAEDGRLFVKQTEDKFWANLGDWLVLQESPGQPNELAPMTDLEFTNTYETTP